jgi:lipopolysaccharide export system protein LptA
MPCITRIFGSFAIVMIAYWAYALLAVPWIEPAADLKLAGAALGDSTPIEGSEPINRELEAIKDLFQPGDWETDRSKTKVLRNDRAKLLLQEYRVLGGGKVRITPCTMVFDYEGPAENEAQRHRQSIILQAPQGAILQFDRPLDLKQPREANLVGGELTGPVCIRSDWKQPGPDDDLRIVTSNVRLENQIISTSEPVEFRWGPHFGSGQDMQIKLLPDRPRPGRRHSGLNIAGIEWFEMRHIERLHLDLGQMDEKGMSAIGRNRPEGNSRPSDVSRLSRSSTPVEIGCRGPFRFDVVGRVATFSDSVHVTKANPIGNADQMDCDMLSITFIERKMIEPNAAGAKTASSSVSMDLTPERIEARGNPVTATAPSENASARAQRIEYNLISKSIKLDGDQPVFLQRGADQVQARSVFYQPAAEKDRLGQVVAVGPGWFHGQSSEQSDQQIEATWREELRIQPHDQYQEISLSGGADLKSPGFGQLQARKILLWLIENPSAAKEDRLKPRILTASEDVHISSPQLSGSKIAQLEVLFEEGDRGQGPGARGQGLATSPNDGLAGQMPLQQNAAGVEASSPSGGLLPATSAEPNSQQHFEIAGQLIRAHVRREAKKTALTRLTIENNVELVETQTERPDQRPLQIRGDRLEATNASAPNAQVTVVGKPARFEGRGLAIVASNINIDRGANRVWIDGPGQMDILIDKDMERRPLPVPSTLTINWQEKMEFDGQTAQFRTSVVAATPGIPSQNEVTQFRLDTAEMDVRLLRPISFAEQRPAQREDEQQIEELRCRNGVTMDSRTFDARQELTSHDQMQLTYLTVNRIDGRLEGGPGSINTVRYGSNQALTPQPLAAPANAPAAAPAKRLICLHVTYRGSLGGNVLRREVTFRDQVQAAYGPADSWDTVLTTDDPNRLGPDGAISRCDQLSVIQMPQPIGDDRAIELYALGNAIVEGTTFKATGTRISYAQAKDLFMIEGDGRSPAELYRQLQAGAQASRLPAQKIFYWRKTNDVKVVGAQMLEVQLPDGRKR